MSARKTNKRVCVQVKGSAQMVLETDKHPAELKDAVCSPGGTTITAMHTLERLSFRYLIPHLLSLLHLIFPLCPIHFYLFLTIFPACNLDYFLF